MTRNIVNEGKLRVRLPLCIHIIPQYNSHSGDANTADNAKCRVYSTYFAAREMLRLYVS